MEVDADVVEGETDDVSAAADRVQREDELVDNFLGNRAAHPYVKRLQRRHPTRSHVACRDGESKLQQPPTQTAQHEPAW